MKKWIAGLILTLATENCFSDRYGLDDEPGGGVGGDPLLIIPVIGCVIWMYVLLLNYYVDWKNRRSTQEKLEHEGLFFPLIGYAIMAALLSIPWLWLLRLFGVHSVSSVWVILGLCFGSVVVLRRT